MFFDWQKWHYARKGAFQCDVRNFFLFLYSHVVFSPFQSHRNTACSKRRVINNDAIYWQICLNFHQSTASQSQTRCYLKNQFWSCIWNSLWVFFYKKQLWVLKWGSWQHDPGTDPVFVLKGHEPGWGRTAVRLPQVTSLELPKRQPLSLVVQAPSLDIRSGTWALSSHIAHQTSCKAMNQPDLDADVPPIRDSPCIQKPMAPYPERDNLLLAGRKWINTNCIHNGMKGGRLKVMVTGNPSPLQSYPLWSAIYIFYITCFVSINETMFHLCLTCTDENHFSNIQ